MSLQIERHRSRVLRQGSDGSEGLVIGLVNNMPDPALEATEAQFARLLSSAADLFKVRLRLSFLAEVPRAQGGLDHISGSGYWPLEDLLREPLDALIVTGMEPCKPLLSDEPYWERMGQLLAWAESNTTSSIWSCLAAHAAVEHLDGIRRRRLDLKRCGVFAHTTLANEPLLADVTAPLYIPHSRWNELPCDALRAAGYEILSFSPETGADMFLKRKGSLFIFFQGHPEYEEITLLREYRRDVGRFLRGQQSHYPTLPHQYFGPHALELLSAFEKRARAVTEAGTAAADLLSEFPLAAIAATLQNRWGRNASGIYRNWLALLASARHVDVRQPPQQVLS